MADKIFRYIPFFLPASVAVVEIQGLIRSGSINLMSYCMAFWLAWVVWSLFRVTHEFAVILGKGDSLI